MMIYKKLENEFLKSTLKFNFNNNLKDFLLFSILVFIALGITSLGYININWHISLYIVIVLSIFLISGLILMMIVYPRVLYYRENKKIKEQMPKFSYKNFRILLFESSKEQLIDFLYQENLNQKTKVALLIKHYESIKVVKANFSFPLLIILSLISSIILSLFALPEEKMEMALAILITFIIGVIAIYGELKLLQMLDGLVFSNNKKYNILLDLLTEVYLTRYGKGNNLLKNPPKNK